MPPLSTDTIEYLAYSPFFAAVEGKPEAEQNTFYGRYDRLPQSVREFLLAPETAEALANMQRDGLFPSNFGVAVAKIVAAVTLNDVTLADVAPLLSKLGLSAEQASRVADGISQLVKPVLAAKAQAVVGTAPREIPPLTQVVGRPSAAGPQGTARNIIDLRRQNPQ